MMRIESALNHYAPASDEPHFNRAARRFVSATGATSTATNFAASASRNLFFQAKNCPLLRLRSMQNAATLCPLWLCSAISPRHLVHASVLRCLIPKECSFAHRRTRCGSDSAHGICHNQRPTDRKCCIRKRVCIPSSVAGMSRRSYLRFDRV